MNLIIDKDLDLLKVRVIIEFLIDIIILINSIKIITMKDDEEIKTGLKY
jgi:hypothetical protein